MSKEADHLRNQAEYGHGVNSDTPSIVDGIEKAMKDVIGGILFPGSEKTSAERSFDAGVSEKIKSR